MAAASAAAASSPSARGAAARVRRGFGAEVIEHAVPCELDGRGVLEFTPDGLRCTIHLPMTPALGSLRELHPLEFFDGEASAD